MEPITPTKVTTTAVAVRYGLLTGLAGSILSFILNIAHLDQSPAKWLGYLVLGGGIVLAQLFYRQHNAGFMSYGEGVGIGTLLSLVSGSVSAVFSYIYTHLVDTEMINRIMDKVRADMEAKGGMTDEQMEVALSWTAKFMSEPILSIFIVFMSLVLGLIGSLIISAVLKNPKPEFE